MARRRRIVAPEVAEAESESAVVVKPADMTPEEAERCVELYDKLAKLEDHIRNAPNNEQYKQELLAVKKELGID